MFALITGILTVDKDTKRQDRTTLRQEREQRKWNAHARAREKKSLGNSEQLAFNPDQMSGIKFCCQQIFNDMINAVVVPTVISSTILKSLLHYLI